LAGKWLGWFCCWFGGGGDGGGGWVEEFLFDAFETVVAEVFELVLAMMGVSGRTVCRLLGSCVHFMKLTFAVTDALHYFNINFIIFQTETG
jgi:hypothetical protein